MKVIYYTLRVLNDAQKNNSTTEKEFLLIVFAFDKFHQYLIILNDTVFTDHESIKYLLQEKDSKPCLLWWTLLLKEFYIDIRYKKGVGNNVVDHLSRLEQLQADL